MYKHIKYLKYVIRHKYYVFRAGMKLKVPIIQLIIHDWTKFLPIEWGPYVNYFYGEKDQEAFDRAWNHHQKHNKHHWQYWGLLKDSGEIVYLEIPTKYMREMIADWMGAGMAIHGKNDINDWYNKNYDKIKLHINTRKMVDEILNVS